jgi:hypothetical protein
VEKRQLISLLHHFDSASSQEANDIISLLKEYPYSQVLHSVSARVSKDLQLSNQQDLLTQAAVYSTDRTVLKEIMTISPPVVEQAKESIAESKKTAAEKPVVEPKILPTTNVDYAEEILADLKKLHESKSNFENAISTLVIP